MESEARLLMYDGGVPTPQLQYVIRDERGHYWRVDFAWPESRVAAEYDSIAWHAGRVEMLRDRAKVACLQDLGWTVVSMTVDDIRYDGAALVHRINSLLSRFAMAG
jgi:very-short-patch-repair endonuclease